MSGTQTTEYSVYVYHKGNKGRKAGPWELKNTTPSMDQAIQDAETLYQSRDYSKIEVKKKFSDPKNGRTLDITLKIFENRLRPEIGAGVIMAVSLLCGVGTFALSCFLTLGAG